MVSHSRCVSLPPPLLGNHEFISCVSAPFPPRFRSPSAIWSPSAFLFVCFIVCVVFFFFFLPHSWLTSLTAEEAAQEEGEVDGCCRGGEMLQREKPVGHLLGSWTGRHTGVGKDGKKKAGPLAFAEPGEQGVRRGRGELYLPMQSWSLLR